MIETSDKPVPATGIDLDLETFGAKEHNPAIVQVAAIATDADGNVVSEFCEYVQLESTERTASIDSSTILWWIGQPDEARLRLVQGIEGGKHISQVLVEFDQWYTSVTNGERDASVWGYGSLADVLWLRSAFRAATLLVPWDRDGRGYRRERCLRTLHAEIGLPWPEFVGTKHDALSDARNQSTQRVRLQRWIAEAHTLMGMQGAQVPEQLG